MYSPIAQLREKRRDLLLILVTAILSAFAVNLITSYLSASGTDKLLWPLVTGLALFLISGIILAQTVFNPPSETLRVSGAVVFEYSKNKVRPVEILGYEFNDDFCEILQGFIHENKAYARIFEKSDKKIVSSSRFNPDELNYHTIMNSVLEFVFLYELELHLNSYFIENEIGRGKIITLTREQLDPSVLKNRVLELITKDMQERPAFSRDVDTDSNRNVIYAPGDDGAVFRKLSIELPPKSRIFRSKEGFLTISNQYFDLCFTPQFEGFSAVIPSILVPSESESTDPLLVRIKIEAKFKRIAFFYNESMELYEWLDSFLNRMENYFSTDKLEERMNCSMLEVLKKLGKI